MKSLARNSRVLRVQRYIAVAHSFMCDENRNVQFYETEKISFSLQKEYFYHPFEALLQCNLGFFALQM